MSLTGFRRKAFAARSRVFSRLLGWINNRACNIWTAVILNKLVDTSYMIAIVYRQPSSGRFLLTRGDVTAHSRVQDWPRRERPGTRLENRDILQDSYMRYLPIKQYGGRDERCDTFRFGRRNGEYRWALETKSYFVWFKKELWWGESSYKSQNHSMIR